MALEIKPLSPALGAEAIGLDPARPLPADEVAAVNAAFLEHHLLCVRAAPLTPAAFDRFARTFGAPKLQLLRDRRDAETPAVSLLDSTYKRPEDKPDDLALVRLSGWHTDDSYFAAPAKATMLQSLALPSHGGETRFCNARRAYDDLPEETKARLQPLRAVHSYDTRRAKARAVKLKPEEAAETPDVVHPLIRTHEDTGAKAIYFNPNRTDRIEAMERGESDRLLDWLYAHMTQAKYRYDHKWRLGDILLWDNRCLVHSVNMDFPVCERRLHQRILLEGVSPR